MSELKAVITKVIHNYPEDKIIRLDDYQDDGTPKLKETISFVDNYDERAKAFYASATSYEPYDPDEYQVRREESKNRRWRKRMFIGQKLAGFVLAMIGILAPSGASVLLIPMGLWALWTRKYLFLAGYGVDDEQ